MKLVLDLNDAETAKLEALAKARDKSPEDCIRDFIATCQPGGGDWKHPMCSAPSTGKKEAP